MRVGSNLNGNFITRKCMLKEEDLFKADICWESRIHYYLDISYQLKSYNSSFKNHAQICFSVFENDSRTYKCLKTFYCKQFFNNSEMFRRDSMSISFRFKIICTSKVCYKVE